MANGPTGGSPDPEVDPIAEILGDTSHADEAQGTPREDAATTSTSSSEAQPKAAAESKIKLGGREYPSMVEADKAHRTLYGKYSESQGLLKWIKSNLKNPQAIAELAKMPGGADIVAKLGLQQAEEEAQAREDAERASSEGLDVEKLPAPMKRLYEEMELREYRMQLRDEEREFQEELGRKIATEEHNKVMETLEAHPSLTFKEAWTLVYHDKIMADALKKAQAAQRPAVARPSPIPGVHKVPGVHLDMKKDPSKMSEDEWREYFKSTPEFQKLVERGR